MALDRRSSKNTWWLAVSLTLAGAMAATAQNAPQKPAPTQKPAPPATQKPTPPQTPAAATNTTGSAPVGVATPPDYVIGPDDVLSIIVWREKDLTGDVQVRPDGKITLPLINDVQAAGLTPEQLRVRLTEAAGKLIEEPNVTVVVKSVNSRKVFLMGEVNKPGPYALSAPMNVLQLIASAGGLLEYADEENILIIRNENGKPVSYKFNYKDAARGKNLKQNIELKPGDTVVVPQ